MSNVASNSSDRFGYDPIPKLNQLNLEEPRTKPTTLNNVDFISNLPDSLLLHILSFLPTRTSMATSVLSRRWRNLWKDLQALDLVVEPYRVNERSKDKLRMYFAEFVNSVIAQVWKIQKFRLSCQVLDYNGISSCIESVVTKHDLQELHLKLWYLCEFRLPRAVFTCASLVSLTLECDIKLDDLPYIHLPSLKILKLERVYHVNFDKLLSGCPVLETLVVIIPLCSSCNKDPQAIHIPRSLKSLTLTSEDFYGETIKYLEIIAPSLEYLHIKLEAGHLRVSVSNFPKMMEACLDILATPLEAKVGWVPEILKAVCKTRSLVLTDNATRFLLRAPALDFLEFGCLLRLKIGFHSFNSKFLVDLLHKCHKLKVLIIHVNERLFPNYLVLKYSGPSHWTQPISVPNCVTSHLNTVKFIGYQDYAEEHAFCAYILRRGFVLKTMTIHTDSSYGQRRRNIILKELSIVPRGSSICQLQLG